MGASGFVATNILRNLRSEYEFIAFSRNSEKENSSHWIETPSIRWPDELLNIVEKESISAVIFCSGTTNLSVKKMKEIYEDLLSSVLEVLKGKGVRLIFFSAGSVERDDSLFAEMNRRAEEKIRNSGVAYFILRPSLVYGPHDNKNLSFIFKLMKMLPVLPLPQKGQVMLQPVHTDDICRFIQRCLDGMVAENSAYTLAGTEPVDLVTLVEIAREISGSKTKFIHLDLNLIKKIISKIPLMPKEQVVNSQEKIIWDNSEFRKHLNEKLTDYRTGIKSLLDSD